MYSFLIYVNPQRKVIDALKLPADGEAFDATKFMNDNGFQDTTAGLGMVVKLGGTADCGGDAPAAVPSSHLALVPAKSSAARPGATSAATAPSGNGSSPDGGAGLPVASSVLQSVGGPAATQTIVLSSAGAEAGASNTATAGFAQQTANAASAVGIESFGLLAPLVAVAGLFMC